MKESVRILRFAIVGSSNALITALVIWILMDILDCNYLWSNMAGYVAAFGDGQPTAQMAGIP